MVQFTPVLTVCDLKLCFGQDAARHCQGLTDIVPRICPLDRCDGQISTGRHRETTVGLLRLIWKQKVLHKENKKQSMKSISRENSLPEIHHSFIQTHQGKKILY